MKRTGLCGILALLCLGLSSLEVRGDDLQRFLAQIQREAASKPMARKPPKPSTGEKAYCEASCGEGTPVSVTCSSCTAEDRDCAAHQRGYVQCSGGAKVECDDPCPPREIICYASSPCPREGDDPVDCEGYEYCVSRPDVCWVMCDGVYTSCPICF